jgi:murein L,D-transpeptidase YcbB/YkuD
LYLVPIECAIKYFEKRNFSYRKNSNYLAKHDMEWVGRRVRQRPGQNVGKVKFIFPNSHIIFMHDTPSKAYLIENKGPLVMVVFG